MSGSGFQVSSSKKQDEDVDISVDGDDTEQYGRSQYPFKWCLSTTDILSGWI